MRAIRLLEPHFQKLQIKKRAVQHHYTYLGPVSPAYVLLNMNLREVLGKPPSSLKQILNVFFEVTLLFFKICGIQDPILRS